MRATGEKKEENVSESAFMQRDRWKVAECCGQILLWEDFWWQ